MAFFEEDKTTVPLGFANDFNPNLESEWKTWKLLH
jgi:hypothetical protein